MVLTELKIDEAVIAVQREIHSKRWIYSAEDARRSAVIVSQRMSMIQEAIDIVCGEACSLASLFECANGRLRKGKTGSFYITRMIADDVPFYIKRVRGRFDRVVIAARVPQKWIIKQRKTEDAE